MKIKKSGVQNPLSSGEKKTASNLKIDKSRKIN